ncbi:MAG: 2-oxoglutarate dehydrogenase E1 component [Phycisphaerales bacterium]|jgi:2-oxoglutarate dehydrogenase E1 component|nr:2-oxoglutarate dehydrogenase E1 component [Phycisphaerales bacterium]
MSAEPKAVAPAVNSWNAAYLDEMYAAYRADRASVPADVRAFFDGFELGLTRSEGGGGEPIAARVGGGTGSLQARVDGLVAAYRDLGHIAAKIDPFGRERERSPDLALSFHGLGEGDLATPVDGTSLGLGASVPLGEVVSFLEDTYCGPIGAEFMHIQSSEERQWWTSTIEAGRGRIELTRGDRVHVLDRLIHAEHFEKFLQKRYPGDKRFSLEGGESLIPLTDHLLERASELGIEQVVLGMAHRGRLNVLSNILGKTHEQIFTEFEDNWDEDFVDGGGDVKYHRGFSGTRRFKNGRMVHLAMASNPSHLEAVGPVVLGRSRAKQDLQRDTERRRIMPIVMHGDAAVIGQGVVAECLNLMSLEGYRVGGTVHIVVNNQIGFTTIPADGRSSRYCTDLAKMIEAPVLHVNGDDPEACVAAAHWAIEYRQKFAKDVFIDMYCYRKYGHNEQDEPSFTQPVLAALIRRKQGAMKIYAERLLAEGVINEADMDAIGKRLETLLDRAQAEAKQKPNDPTIDPGSARWTGVSNKFSFKPSETAVSEALLREVCTALGHVPEGFNLNPKLRALLEGRAGLLETRQISYADAESLAYGTLVCEGYPVRLSGQDCRRGTFSHRHAVLRDAETGEPYTPLASIRPVDPSLPRAESASEGPVQARFEVYDSPLSEAAVLGFEYGYSLAEPNQVVLWEAQFGDFVNGAQVIIDQFIAAAELKWQRWSGLTLLLPHGYEGAGPEHSSCRFERFLKLCAEDNLQVVYPSTAAQAFHMLRRQVKRSFRKPLIVVTPKSMLRTPTSDIGELMSGGFQEIIDDPTMVTGGKAAREGVRRVVLCTGKIYHELEERRRETGVKDVALVRIEQLYPLHIDRVKEVLALYPRSERTIWVQEEPRNMGAFGFITEQLRDRLGIKGVEYIGRPASSTPAPGSKRIDRQQQNSILTQAIAPKPGQPAGKDDKKPAMAGTAVK